MAWTRLQFHLRTLLLGVAICVIACYWTVRPTFVANHFAAAIDSHRFDTVDELLVEDRDWATDFQLANIQMELKPLTFRQLVRGERWFTGYLPRGEKSMEEYDWLFSLRVTRSGVETFLLIH